MLPTLPVTPAQLAEMHPYTPSDCLVHTAHVDLRHSMAWGLWYLSCSCTCTTWDWLSTSYSGRRSYSVHVHVCTLVHTVQGSIQDFLLGGERTLSRQYRIGTQTIHSTSCILWVALQPLKICTCCSALTCTCIHVGECSGEGREEGKSQGAPPPPHTLIGHKWEGLPFGGLCCGSPPGEMVSLSLREMVGLPLVRWSFSSW